MTPEMEKLAKDWVWIQVMRRPRRIDDRDVSDYLDGLTEGNKH